MKKTNETSNKRNQCKVCGGIGQPSKALLNDLVAMQDFGGETTKTRGATLSRVGKANIVDCIKCMKCGHSWIPEKSTTELALEWWKQQKAPFEIMRRCGFSDNRFISLTGREIEEIWRKETQDEKLNKDHEYEQQAHLAGAVAEFKPNQKQFKEFNPELFKQYIDKFSDDHKFNMFLVLLKEFKLESSIESNIMTLIALKNIE